MTDDETKKRLDALTEVVNNLQVEFRYMRNIIVAVWITIVAPLIIAFIANGGFGKK